MRAVRARSLLAAMVALLGGTWWAAGWRMAGVVGIVIAIVAAGECLSSTGPGR